jgi:hypothetical protein
MWKICLENMSTSNWSTLFHHDFLSQLLCFQINYSLEDKNLHLIWFCWNSHETKLEIPLKWHHLIATVNILLHVRLATKLYILWTPSYWSCVTFILSKCKNRFLWTIFGPKAEEITEYVASYVMREDIICALHWLIQLSNQWQWNGQGM